MQISALQSADFRITSLCAAHICSKCHLDPACGMQAKRRDLKKEISQLHYVSFEMTFQLFDFTLDKLAS